jgi:hypothetical protein
MAGGAVNVSASGVVSAVPCKIEGFYVNSTSSGTIVIYDNASTSSGAITGTITPAIGWHKFPAKLSQGCYVVIANTLNVTFFVSG